MFIEVGHKPKEFVNQAHIVSAQGVGADQLDLHMVDGRTIRVHRRSFDPQSALPIVPAAPGFVALEYHGPEWLARDPIIAWRVDEHLGAWPVTPEGDGSSAAILYPDGQVVEPGVGNWETIDEWLSHKRDEAGSDTDGLGHQPASLQGREAA